MRNININRSFKKDFEPFTTSEFYEQKTLFSWAKYNPRLKWMFAIPNGGKRDPKVGYIMKLQGVKPGVSDIFLPIPSKGFHGLFIEMKRKGNKTSPLQKEFISDMTVNGYMCIVCFSAEEAIENINYYLRRK